MPWWLSVYLKPILMLASGLGLVGWMMWQSNRVDHWREQARAAESAVKTAQIAAEAARVKGSVRERVEEIRAQTRNMAVSVDLVTDPRLADWLDRVFGESTDGSAR